MEYPQFYVTCIVLILTTLYLIFIVLYFGFYGSFFVCNITVHYFNDLEQLATAPAPTEVISLS